MRTTAAGVAGLATLSLGADPVAAHDTFQIMEGTQDETTVYVMDSGNSGPTTLVVGGMHGNEHSGIEAGENIQAWNVKQGQLVILPRAAEYAIERNQRGIDHDPADLNRHFPASGGQCDSPLAQAIWQDVVVPYDPDLAIDLHSSHGIYDNGTGVGQAVFPTGTSPARSMGENAIADLNSHYGLTGDEEYVMGNTLWGSGDKLIRRVQGLLGIPGYIMETYRGFDLSRQVNWHEYLVEHLMDQTGQDRGSPGVDDPPFSSFKTMTEWQWVEQELYNDFNDPVIISLAPTYNGSQPGHIRLAWITDGNFYHHFEEWEYMDKQHVDEKAHCLVAEKGVYQLADGRTAEVGTLTAQHQFVRTDFSASFDETPIILAHCQTYNGSDAVTTRLGWPSSEAFSAYVQEEEAGGSHLEEEIGYIALEPGTGEVFGLEGEVDSITTDENWATINFDKSYTTPVFVAGLQSWNGSNTADVRQRNLSSGSVEVKVEEEQSEDSETGHTDEEIGYVVTELGRN